MSDYINHLRNVIHSSGSAYSQAQARRSERALGMRTPASDLRERQALRDAYDKTCK